VLTENLDIVVVSSGEPEIKPKPVDIDKPKATSTVRKKK
jgi:hypothetical protein